MWLRGLLFFFLLGVLAIGTLLLVPRTWLPRPIQDLAYQYIGEESYREPPPSRQINPVSVEPFCLDRHADWRESQTLEGVAIAASPVCEPDNPAEIAAFVKGTNNISLHTLMETRLTPNTVVKENDRDGDGDPDEIHVRLEVVELNGHSPDDPAPFPAYAIAPGVQPGLWVFAPKSRGMATENFESEWAHPTLRAPSPVIRVEQDDTLRVTLENAHYLPHTIHFHGVDHPFVDATGEGNDGVPIASEMPVSPGESRTYEMTPRQTGTMFYHCHVQPHVHILMGLQGMFVVEDNRPNNWLQTLNIGAGRVRAVSAAVSESYDREFDLHYQDIDPALNNIIQTAGDPRLIAEATNRRYDITDQEPDYFLLNGRSFPYTTRESLVVVAPNERVKLRVLNGGAEGISLHTHGHKVRITHYDGVEHNPVAQITRDVVWISPAQRVDLLLNTTDDGRHNYGPGVWLLHDHKEKAITTDGINPGGNISAIVYQDYLDTSGQPKTQGMDWAPFFTKEYYQKKLPVWAGLEDFGLLGEAGARSLPLSYALILGVGIGLLIGAAFALRKRGSRSVLIGCIVLTSLSSGVGSAQEHESHHHHAHHGMQLDTAGMVMNENTDQLPRGCPRLSGEHEITVRAGKEFARPGTMFAYDRNEWSFAPCTKLTVTLINTDTVRHQWMLHGLPRYIYPMGMFTLEVAGKGQRTGTFILPPGDKTYLVHCDVSQHMEKGMKAQLKVGAGDGDLPSIPGVTGPRRRDPYVLVWNGWTHGAVVLFGLVGALFVGRKLRLSP